jgi:aspartyl-tRNA(Asn)/glutamyl-tRNA(Gln) amidotransferase subunit C
VKGGKYMGVSVEDVKYAAGLARLEFSEDKLQRFTEDLNGILGYVNELNELDTEGVDASVNPIFIQNAFREDEVQDSLDREEVLQNAPDRQDGYFIVPKVIEG